MKKRFDGKLINCYFLTEGSCQIQCCSGDLCNSKCHSATPSTVVSMTTATVGACSSNPCIEGQCSPTTDTCECNTGFYGLHCEYKIDNDGSSTEQPSTVNSIATTEQPCVSNPCVTGTCSVIGDSYQCACPGDRTGQNCEVQLPATTTTTQSPCLCVHGHCEIRNDYYVCECYEGFTGTYCQYRSTQPPSTTATIPTTTITTPQTPATTTPKMKTTSTSSTTATTKARPTTTSCYYNCHTGLQL